MIEAVLFVEDSAHHAFVGALARRVFHEEGLELRLHVRSANGGRPRALSELGRYVRDVDAGREPARDFLIVATDANCLGLAEWQRQVLDRCGAIEERNPGFTVVAVPDPHIERWFLVDSQAFKAVFGRGCQAPDLKCERNRYKDFLVRAILESGVRPLLGGREYAEDIVANLGLDRALTLDGSLGRTVQDLRRKAQQCARARSE